MFNQNLGDRCQNSKFPAYSRIRQQLTSRQSVLSNWAPEPRETRDPRCSTVPFHFSSSSLLSRTLTLPNSNQSYNKETFHKNRNTQASIDIHPYGKHLLKTPSPTSQQKSRTEDNMSRSTPSNSLPRPRMVHSSNDASHHQDDKSSSRSRSNISTSGQSNSAMKGVKDIDVLCG